MSLERWIAVFFLLFSIAYIYGAVTYPLLPFERNMTFLPNTLPIGLGVFGIVFSLILIFTPSKVMDNKPSTGDIDVSRLGEYKIGQAVALLITMVVYALLLRPIGFVAATTSFLSVAGFILGERKFHILLPVSLLGTVIVWYLVQQVLGVFLRPWPALLS